MTAPGSTVVRRQLGRRLRKLRELAGKTAADVEEAKLVSAAKLWRIETGKTPVKIPDVRALCWLYDADARTTDALAGLAVGTAGRGWWEEYGDVMPEWFKLYVDLEVAADEIRSYDPLVVPGLFQTADYARAVYRAAQPGDGEEAIRRHVALRLERQQNVLGRPDPARIVAVLDEAVPRRAVGSAEVMAAQVARLRDLDRRDHVEIRVLAAASGAHAAMAGGFVLLDFDEPDDPPVVYLETQVGARYLEEPAQLDTYRTIFDLAAKQAVPLEEYPP